MCDVLAKFQKISRVSLVRVRECERVNDRQCIVSEDAGNW